MFATDLRQLWLPLGRFGYSTDADGVVLYVRSGSPASRAGIGLGDRVDLSLTPPQFRSDVVQATYVWKPGQTVTFNLIHQGTGRTITLKAEPSPDYGWAGKLFTVIFFIAAILFIVLGAALVLVRPNLMTWGVFLLLPCFLTGKLVRCVVASVPRGMRRVRIWAHCTSGRPSWLAAFCVLFPHRVCEVVAFNRAADNAMATCHVHSFLALGNGSNQLDWRSARRATFQN